MRQAPDISARLVVIREARRRLGWLLLTANGRNVARSATLYRSDDELHAAFSELMADRHSLTFGFGRDAGRTWCWTAFLPARSTAQTSGKPIARGGRGYLRQDQCRDGTVSFVSALDRLPSDGWTPGGALNGRLPRES